MWNSLGWDIMSKFTNAHKLIHFQKKIPSWALNMKIRLRKPETYGSGNQKKKKKGKKIGNAKRMERDTFLNYLHTVLRSSHY